MDTVLHDCRASVRVLDYRNLFSATLNDLREGADLSCSGRLFQRQSPL